MNGITAYEKDNVLQGLKVHYDNGDIITIGNEGGTTKSINWDPHKTGVQWSFGLMNSFSWAEGGGNLNLLAIK